MTAIDFYKCLDSVSHGVSHINVLALYKEADAEVTRVNFNGDLLLLPSILVHSVGFFLNVS